MFCRAAVHFEKGEYEEAIQVCDSAVERGRELRADYKLVAKALTRKGNSYVKLGRLEDAVQAYHKALTEHRYTGAKGSSRDNAQSPTARHAGFSLFCLYKHCQIVARRGSRKRAQVWLY